MRFGSSARAFLLSSCLWHYQFRLKDPKLFICAGPLWIRLSRPEPGPSHVLHMVKAILLSSTPPNYYCGTPMGGLPSCSPRTVQPSPPAFDSVATASADRRRRAPHPEPAALPRNAGGSSPPEGKRCGLDGVSPLQSTSPRSYIKKQGDKSSTFTLANKSLFFHHAPSRSTAPAHPSQSPGVCSSQGIE